MKSLKEIMEEYSIELYLGDPTFWTVEQVEEIARRYKLQVLDDVKFGFDLCSDASTHCIGYRNLIERIKREKENKPIDKSISPIKPYKNE
jgi:hypothetical protein